jgi:hypothetical protein
MKTIFSSVAFQDESGALLTNGSIILTLPAGIYEISAGGGQVVGRSLIVNLTAAAKMPGAIQIWASDELNPQVAYTVTLCAGGWRTAGRLGDLAISGASPIDLSL